MSAPEPKRFATFSDHVWSDGTPVRVERPDADELAVREALDDDRRDRRGDEPEA